MDMMSSAKWLSEFEMEVDPAFNYQYQMNPLDYSIDELDFNSFSSKSYSTSNPPTLNPQTTQKLQSSPTMERPTKQLKTNSWGSCISDQGNNNNTPKASPCSSHIISFDNSNLPAETTYQQFSYGVESTVKPKTNKVGSSTHYGQGYKKSAVVRRTPLHAQDHVIAERKRREKLIQRFIALSAVVPGLKKTDKASVLGEAIRYLKQLQERVNVLEEQAAKKTMESVIYVKNSQVYGDDGSSSSDENFDGGCDQLTLPKLEARVCGRDVLIRVNCDKQKGCFVRILGEIEKLPLTVINSSTLPFGNATLDITIVAQMDNEFSVTGKDIVKSLRHALL